MDDTDGAWLRLGEVEGIALLEGACENVGTALGIDEGKFEGWSLGKSDGTSDGIKEGEWVPFFTLLAFLAPFCFFLFSAFKPGKSRKRPTVVLMPFGAVFLTPFKLRGGDSSEELEVGTIEREMKGADGVVPDRGLEFNEGYKRWDVTSSPSAKETIIAKRDVTAKNAKERFISKVWIRLLKQKDILRRWWIALYFVRFSFEASQKCKAYQNVSRKTTASWNDFVRLLCHISGLKTFSDRDGNFSLKSWACRWSRYIYVFVPALMAF